MTWWQRLVSSHPSPVGEGGGDAGVHYGRALQGLAARLKKLPHPCLLDLGHTCGANIDFFVQLGCKVHVDDYATSLLDRPPVEVEKEEPVKAGGASGSPGGFPASAKPKAPVVHIPPVEHETGQFDAILCWDLFDYLTPPEAEVLAREINRVTAPGGFLLALFGPARDTSPRPPRRFRIEGERSVRPQALNAPPIRPQHLANRDIARLFRDFEISQTVLLKDGTREMMLHKRRGARSPLQEPRMVSVV